MQSCPGESFEQPPKPKNPAKGSPLPKAKEKKRESKEREAVSFESKLWLIR